MRFGLGILLVLSGFASLTFQIAWVRLIGLSIGGSSASVSVVVTAFFGGLSAGSFLAPRLLRTVAPFRAYLSLELCIGLLGLVSLPLLLRLDDWMALVPSLGSTLAFKFVVASLLLIVPTACMGATFPIAIAVAQQRTSALGLAYGELYALNTLGAVAGAALCGFVLVPLLGLDGAIWTAAAVNFAVVGLGWGMRDLFAWQAIPEAKPLASLAAQVETEASPGLAESNWSRPLLVLAGTGFISIVVEICWTKFLSMFVGTTLYGFSAVLAIYLFGIAAGSFAIRRYLDRIEQPELALGLGLIVLALMILASSAGLNLLPYVQRSLDKRQFAPLWADLYRYAVVLLTLLPATLTLGALFPLSLRAYCPEGGARVGLAYSVNTLAGIVASIGSGIFWIPTYGTSAVLRAAAVLAVVLSLIFLDELQRPRLKRVSQALWAAAGLLAVFQPPLQLEKLINSVRQDRFQLPDSNLRLLYLKEGKTGVISAATADGVTAILYDSGLRESIVTLQNPDSGLFVESMLSLYPYLLHAQPKSAFVVGYGGGATTRALEFTAVEAIRVVELEPAIRSAVVTLLGSGPSGLRDPRLKFEINDARNALLLDTQKYDIIASQPSHPWRAGAGTIFTSEFFSLAASRLNPGGIYSQWVNLFRMDIITLKAILRSFTDVFPEVICFVHPGTSDMLLLGAQQPLVFSEQRVAARMVEPRVAHFLWQWGITSVPGLISSFGLSRPEILEAVGPGVRSTDTNLLPEVRLARAGNWDAGSGLVLQFLNAHARFDVASHLEPRARERWLQESLNTFSPQRPGLSTREQIEARLHEAQAAGLSR